MIEIRDFDFVKNMLGEKLEQKININKRNIIEINIDKIKRRMLK